MKLWEKVLHLETEIIGAETDDSTPPSTPEKMVSQLSNASSLSRASTSTMEPIVPESDESTPPTMSQITEFLDRTGWLRPDAATVNTQRLAQAAKLCP